MGPTLRRGEVAANEEVAPGIFLLRVKGKFVASPGQFYMLRAWERDPPLSRPMSVFSLEEREISFLYEVRGRGTRLLSRLAAGDELTLLGPLGRGWERPPRPLALVGGGTGIAPLHFAAQIYGGDAYLGFRGKPYLVERFADWCREVHVASETGEGGVKGVVTDIFRPGDYKACFACGPEAMLRELYRICKGNGLPLTVSLEERMACGVGACLGCTIVTAGGPKRVCADGPVFPAEELGWDG